MTNFDQIRGKAKEATGKVTGNEEMTGRGQADQAKGKAKQAAKKVKDRARESGENARDTFTP
ncbi:CsbD family protein [Planomonospora venezuelensis]|uniref:Uncharacterized protein YjbJ (UPF0337 family) n=1 Tax=Planomonospora venezuelensis TaxID=1999 RepID=A0A841D0L6_PLAVE|nr:CsbD family protein [Planomonospora venezuelensis]MBB5964202.1 uncharacterized protein YjbJ (UPF0337 family) [Planomonospora venezuelensis]GIN04388.1 hypothetical protein Pve01_60460 [Planomonospora venezuelensis]